MGHKTGSYYALLEAHISPAGAVVRPEGTIVILVSATDPWSNVRLALVEDIKSGDSFTVARDYLRPLTPLEILALQSE